MAAVGGGGPGGDGQPDQDGWLPGALQDAYRGVYDYEKHQDDQIGRYLAAVAFLSGGAATALFASGVIGLRYDIGGHTVAVPAILLASFLVLSALTLLILLASLGPNVTFTAGGPGTASTAGGPGTASTAGGPVGPGVTSPLFFLPIAQSSRDQWERFWSGPDRRPGADLRDVLVADY